VEAAQAVASQFLPEGLIMYEVGSDGRRTDWRVNAGGIATDDLPMVVLVNEMTASAAEVVAGALQDAGRAKIVGAGTLGRGSANEFEELSDGSALYLPVTHWYTPSGRLIQGRGIAPDIEVGIIPEDRVSGVDSQLLEAYNYLNGLLAETIPFR
jgi:carboxyl-terminal processing protease